MKLTEKEKILRSFKQEFKRVLLKTDQELSNKEVQKMPTLYANSYLKNIFKQIAIEERRIEEQLPIYLKKREIIESVVSSK